jgi:hypothetical protein
MHATLPLGALLLLGLTLRCCCCLGPRLAPGVLQALLLTSQGRFSQEGAALLARHFEVR